MHNVGLFTSLRASFWSLLAGPLTLESYKTRDGSYREVNTRILEPKKDSLAIRMFIRLTILYQHGQLAPSQWKTILALQSHKDSLGTSAKLDLSAIDADIRLVKEATACDMSEHNLQHLYWQVSTISS